MLDYESRLTYTREDALCDELIDLYLQEKKILQQQPRLSLPAPAIATLMIRSENEWAGYVATVQQWYDNVTDIHPGVGGLVIFGAAAAVFLKITHTFLMEGLAEMETQKAGQRNGHLSEIDLKRYTLTYENPEIFTFPHHLYAETPALYRKRHLNP